MEEQRIKGDINLLCDFERNCSILSVKEKNLYCISGNNASEPIGKCYLIEKKNLMKLTFYGLPPLKLNVIVVYFRKEGQEWERQKFVEVTKGLMKVQILELI